MTISDDSQVYQMTCLTPLITVPYTILGSAHQP